MTHIYVIYFEYTNVDITELSNNEFVKLAFGIGLKYSISDFEIAFNKKGFDNKSVCIRAIDDGEQTQQTNLHRKFARNRNLVIDHLQSNLKDAKDFWSDGTDKSFIVGWLQQTIVQAIKMLKQN